MSDQHQQLREFVELVVEKKVREADVTGGKKARYGSKKHVNDLEKRIRELDGWRQKHKKGSEHRANYTRVINKLKNELQGAKRANLKEGRYAILSPDQVTSEHPHAVETALKRFPGEELVFFKDAGAGVGNTIHGTTLYAVGDVEQPVVIYNDAEDYWDEDPEQRRWNEDDRARILALAGKG